MKIHFYNSAGQKFVRNMTEEEIRDFNEGRYGPSENYPKPIEVHVGPPLSPREALEFNTCP